VEHVTGQDIQPKRDLTQFVKWPEFLFYLAQSKKKLKVLNILSQIFFILACDMALLNALNIVTAPQGRCQSLALQWEGKMLHIYKSCNL